MAIRRIEIQNFKSFRHQTIELGQFNILIGANASGKSNFLQIFQFLSDITRHGLENAIFIQGGVKYLRNANLADQENLALKIIIDCNYSYDGLINSEATNVPKMTYEFVLEFDKQGLGFKVVRDKFTYKLQNKAGEFTINHVNDFVSTDNSLGDFIPTFVQESFLHKKLKPQTLLLEQPLFQGIFAELNQIDLFNQLSVYDFDAKQAKKTASIEGKVNLEQDTRNLAIVLQHILANQEDKRLFFNMLSYVLPFVKDVQVEPVAEKYLVLTVKEAYSQIYIPSAFLSQGTVNAISLVIALYCEEKPLLLIEEPDKNIYPYLIEGIIELFKEVSENKQIIMTTHTSQVVKYADSNNLLFISRDNQGFSIISRPIIENPDVKTFLQNFEVEDLYAQDLLGI